MSAAIVTGGSSGIGRASALGLARAGLDVGITHYRDRAGADALVAEAEALGRRAAAVELDLTEPSSAGAAIDGLADALGGELRVLVNCAGVNPRARTLDATLADWTSTLNANLIGAWACAQAAARRMVAAGAGGRIVNVTSVLAFAPLDGGGPYGASKAGLDNLTKVMALELAEHGIAVNAVAPGHAATPMNYAAGGADAALAHRPVIPQARAATADEVAQAICFLASDAASYATGASLVVDGGLLLASGPQQLADATEHEGHT
jgi:NAD(P)-dependent dehydrogenase (short-subunit alcohol dehydrogenase family)